jgi:VWFA-related protein
LSGEGYGLNVWINKVNSASCPSVVSVDVTVTDVINNIPLLSLTQANFKLYQSGQLQNITAITNENPSPVSMVLAMDWTESTLNIRAQMQAAAVTFISQMKAVDYAAICKFNWNVGIDFFPAAAPLFKAGDAAGKTDLNAYINLPYSGDGTNLYDAVIRSVDRAAEPGFTPKRAVIILSDGVDNFSSAATLEQAIAYAKLKEIQVFTIYYVDVNYQGGNYGNPEIMQRLASETGGQYYNVITSDIASIFQQIKNVLSNKYTLTYAPSTCSGTITVEADYGILHGEGSTTFP